MDQTSARLEQAVTPARDTAVRRAARGRPLDLLPFWLILPTLLVLLLVQVYPAVYTVWLSLQQREGLKWVFVGSSNYTHLLHSTEFAESVGHTLIFLVGYVALTLVAGFCIALLLNQKLRLSGFYVTVLFLPWIIADLMAGVIFRLLVLPDYGVLAGILQNPAIIPPHGLSVLTQPPPQPLVGSFPFPPAAALIYLILATTWRALPFVTLLLLAAIQTVPGEVVESSQIDGASGLQVIRFITVPLILPTMVVALFSLTLTGMNSFAMVFSLTQGGPGTSTEVLSMFLYALGWNDFDYGRAAALAMLIAVVNWLLIAGTLRTTRTEQRSA